MADPKFIQPTDRSIGRLLSWLVDNYPGTRPVLAALHAAPQKISVGLRPDEHLMTVMGSYSPKDRAIKVSPYLPQPDAGSVTMHEASHAHDDAFGSPIDWLKNPDKSPFGALSLMEWQKANVPLAGNRHPREALADWRAHGATGIAQDLARLTKNPNIWKADDWASKQPIWPLRQQGAVDDAYMQAILGPDVFAKIRGGTYRVGPDDPGMVKLRSQP